MRPASALLLALWTAACSPPGRPHDGDDDDTAELPDPGQCGIEITATPW